jgi:hypothetical protein
VNGLGRDIEDAFVWYGAEIARVTGGAGARARTGSAELTLWLPFRTHGPWNVFADAMQLTEFVEGPGVDPATGAMQRNRFWDFIDHWRASLASDESDALVASEQASVQRAEEVALHA